MTANRSSYHQAILDGDTALVQKFLDEDAARANERALLTRWAGRLPSGGETPLLLAIHAGSTAIAALLLERGAKVDACGYVPDTVRVTRPVDLAMERRSVPMVETLFAHGLEVTRDELDSMLMRSVRQGTMELARFLLERGGSPRRSVDGVTPMFVAALEGHVPMMEFLLDRGAPVDSPGKVDYTSYEDTMEFGGTTYLTSQVIKGITPLYGLLLQRRIDGEVLSDLCRWLLGHGANPNARGLKGRSALEVIIEDRCEAGHQDRRTPGGDLVEMFLGHGADPNTQARRGLSVLAFARSQFKADAAERLIRFGAREGP